MVKRRERIVAVRVIEGRDGILDGYREATSERVGYERRRIEVQTDVCNLCLFHVECF